VKPSVIAKRLEPRLPKHKRRVKGGGLAIAYRDNPKPVTPAKAGARLSTHITATKPHPGLRRDDGFSGLAENDLQAPIARLRSIAFSRSFQREKVDRAKRETDEGTRAIISRSRTNKGKRTFSL
jgi:hypothetical protein